jgi:putative SOS response-associated peptidase YedK
MCYYTEQTALAIQIEKRFKAIIEDLSLFAPQAYVNGFDFPATPIIKDSTSNTVSFYNWGLIPSWSTTQDIKSLTLNAKIETINEKPSFRNIINQRCLVIATAFYEWQWLDSKGKNKAKYRIGVENEELFAFAGLYSKWEDSSTKEVKNTYTIVTTQANTLMATIHNTKKRMPIILNKEDEKAWLEHKLIEDFAYPYEANLKATKISPDTLTLW